MVEAARNLASQFVVPVTFAVHAGMARNSWDKFESVLSESRSYTVTLFAANDDLVKPEDLTYIREHSESSKIFYDLPGQLKTVW